MTLAEAEALEKAIKAAVKRVKVWGVIYDQRAKGWVVLIRNRRNYEYQVTSVEEALRYDK